MSDSVCPLPTKLVDEQYKNLISQYEELGPEDPSFMEAINDLKTYTPSSATKALMKCEMQGGRKNRKMRRGGAASKKACYIKALAKVTMGVAGVGAAGYYYLMPFVTSATGRPCAGLTDQAFGYLGSWVDPTMSCTHRQKAFDEMTMNYIANIAKLTGLTLGGAILKAPKTFKAIVKYLAAKECPELFDNYSIEDLQRELSSSVQPATTSFVPSQANPQPTEEKQEYFEDPEEKQPARRTTRGKRGGKKQRKTKKRGGKKSRKSKLRKMKKRQTRRY